MSALNPHEHNTARRRGLMAVAAIVTLGRLACGT